jgi:hypothetical protein
MFFNHAITPSVIPSMWKVTIVRPVAKVGTPSSPSDFRPISVVSILSMSTIAVCCQIFSLDSGVGIVPQLR